MPTLGVFGYRRLIGSDRSGMEELGPDPDGRSMSDPPTRRLRTATPAHPFGKDPLTGTVAHAHARTEAVEERIDVWRPPRPS